MNLRAWDCRRWRGCENEGDVVSARKTCFGPVEIHGSNAVKDRAKTRPCLWATKQAVFGLGMFVLAMGCDGSVDPAFEPTGSKDDHGGALTSVCLGDVNSDGQRTV